ncbi:unnamed protein product [Scytosiphon promiscuus]
MALFVKALRLGTAIIKTQVVQAISILFQNLRSPTSLYMLLSQNHINRLIQPEGGAAAELPLHDEEFLTNYVALLKAISVRLSKETVHFFLSAIKGSFPLFSQSVPLIAHPDPMVRTSALNIVLHVVSVRDPVVTAFLALEENHGRFFDQVSRLMQDAYSQILCRMWEVVENAGAGESTAMEGATSFFQDMLYYVQDVLSVADPAFAERMAQHIHRTFFRPASGDRDVAPSMAGVENGIPVGAVGGEREPEIQLALYALCQLFMLATDGRLLGLVAAELFGEGGSGDGCGGTVCLPAAARSSAHTGQAGCQPGASGSCHDLSRTANGGALSAAVAAEGRRPYRRTGSPALAERRATPEIGSTPCYRRALLSCVKRRRPRPRQGEGLVGGQGAQVRLGAMAVLRSAVKNPSVAAEIIPRGGRADRPSSGKNGVGEGREPGRLTEFGGSASGCTGGRRKQECFEEVMVCLLGALVEPPADDMVAVRTAAATLEELCLFEMSTSSGGGGDCDGGDRDFDEKNGGAGAVRNSGSEDGPTATHAPPSGNLRALDARHRWFTVMLTDAYARSAEILLDAATGDDRASALLSACEQATEFLSIGGVVSDGDVRILSPPPRLGDVVRSLLTMVGADTNSTAAAALETHRGIGRGGGRGDDLARFRVSGGDGDDFPTRHVQDVFLALWSLEWGSTNLPPSTATMPGKRGSNLPVDVCVALPPYPATFLLYLTLIRKRVGHVVEALHLLLTSFDHVVRANAPPSRSSERFVFPHRIFSSVWRRYSTASLLPPPSPGSVRLSGKLCLTCCLPFNWPGESAAPPLATGGGSGQAAGKSTGMGAAAGAASAISRSSWTRGASCSRCRTRRTPPCTAVSCCAWHRSETPRQKYTRPTHASWSSGFPRERKAIRGRREGRGCSCRCP